MLANIVFRRTKIFFIKPDIRRKSLKILDLGCGTGFLTCHLEKLYTDSWVVGLDPRKSYLKEAKRKLNGIIVEGNGLCLPFREESFDIVCLYDVIHHIKIRKKFFKEVKKILKKDGYLFIKDVEKGITYNFFINLIMDLLQFLAYRENFGDYYSQEQWNKTLLHHNFDVLDIKKRGCEISILCSKIGNY